MIVSSRETFHFSRFRPREKVTWLMPRVSIVYLEIRWKLQKWTNLLDFDKWNHRFSSEVPHFCHFHFISIYTIDSQGVNHVISRENFHFSLFTFHFSFFTYRDFTWNFSRLAIMYIARNREKLNHEVYLLDFIAMKKAFVLVQHWHNKPSKASYTHFPLDVTVKFRPNRVIWFSRP